VTGPPSEAARRPRWALALALLALGWAAAVAAEAAHLVIQDSVDGIGTRVSVMLAVLSGRSDRVARSLAAREDDTTLEAWSVLGFELATGLLLLHLFARVPRPLGAWSLLLGAAATVPLAAALLTALRAFAFVRADTWSLHSSLGGWGRVAAFAGLALAAAWLAWRVAPHLVGWAGDEHAPHEARRRRTALLAGVCLPLAVGALASVRLHRPERPEGYVLAGALVALLAFVAWRRVRTARPAADAPRGEPLTRRPVALALALAMLAVLGQPRLDGALGGASGRDSTDLTYVQRLRTWPESFPRTQLVEGLLAARQVVRRPYHETLRFAPGPDGIERLWSETRDGVVALTPALEPDATYTLPEGQSLLTWVHAKGRAPFALTRSGGHGSEEIHAFVQGGERRWTFPCPRGRFEAWTLLHDETGPAGVLVGLGGEPGVAALHLDGTPRWSLPNHHVIYDVTSHPALPGYALEIGGDAVLMREQPGGAAVSVVLGRQGPGMSRLDAGSYLTHGALFPDAEGRPALLVSGQSGDDPPVLVRLAHDGSEVWRADLANEPEALLRLETDVGPRLFVVVTEAGEVLVVGEDGTLHARERLPDVSTTERTPVYECDAGPWAPGVHGLTVELLHATYAWHAHPEVLAPR
jgi:hypothetical protein